MYGLSIKHATRSFVRLLMLNPNGCLICTVAHQCVNSDRMDRWKDACEYWPAFRRASGY
jgi:hypothetical protein